MLFTWAMHENQNKLHPLDEVINDIRARGALVVRGLTALRDLKHLLERATREFGIQVTWDPNSEPALADWLGGATIGALHGALAGAGIGLVLGALIDDIEFGAAIGALLGATGGAVYGVSKIAEGWRVRVWYDEAGVPSALVKVIR